MTTELIEDKQLITEQGERSAKPLSVPKPAVIVLSLPILRSLSCFCFHLPLSVGFFFLIPSLSLSQAASHQPVLVANAELSGCDNISPMLQLPQIY